MSKKRQTEGCETNMTPMIDVVFQLIIFFIVTINIADAKDESVQLELGSKGEEIDTNKEVGSAALIIDVNRFGQISIAGRGEGGVGMPATARRGNFGLRISTVRMAVREGYKKYGKQFQVWIRGDANATHKYIQKVMNVCSSEGVARVSFIAIKEAKTTESIHYAESVRNRR